MSGAKKQFHTFHLDKSVLKVPVRLDEPFNQYFLDYLDEEIIGICLCETLRCKKLSITMQGGEL